MAQKFLTGVDLQGQKASNAADPSAPTDLVTMQWAQALVRGLSWKTSARAGSTTNVSLTAPGATIDGVTLLANDRVLVKNQTTATENGVYVWTASAATLTRASDLSTGPQLQGATITVTEGTTNHDTVWTQTADGTSEVITPGTTALAFVQVGGSSAVYTAGSGLSLTGQTFAVVAGSGIIADAASVRVDPSVVARKQAFNVGDGTSTTLTIPHTLNTQDVDFTLTDTTASRVAVWADVSFPTTTSCVVTFAVAPAAAAYRITLVG